MSTTWKNIQEELVDKLNAQSFSPTFVATRSYYPKDDLTEMKVSDKHIVTVFPGQGYQVRRLNRGTMAVLYPCAIAFTKKFKAGDTLIDDSLKLQTDVLNFLYDQRYVTAGAQTKEVTVVAPYDAAKLKDLNVFQGLIQVNLEGYEAIANR